jgi:hypothetical protein
MKSFFRLTFAISDYAFLFWELRGLSPNFHIHVSVSGREGLGGPNSDEGTDTVVLQVCMDFVLYMYRHGYTNILRSQFS